MKTNLFRYLVKEQIVPLSVSLIGVSFVLVTGRLLQLAGYLFTSSVTLVDLLEVMAFAMPKLILYALPLVSMMGVMLAFVRLNSDNELVAFRAAGVSFAQFLPSVLFVLCLTTVSSFYNAIFIMPHATHAFELKIKSLGQASLPALLKENTFIDMIPKLVFFFHSVNPSDLSIQGVFLQDQRQAGVRLTIVAEDAQILYQAQQNQVVFHIRNGVITRVPENIKDAQVISFSEYDVAISLDELLGSSDESGKSKSAMTLSELLDKIHEAGRKPNTRLAMEFHQRLALPVGCLLLGLVGAPLGAIFRQRNRMTGIALGLSVYLVYYVILSGGKGFGKNALIGSSIAVWLPNVLTLAVAVYLWVKMQRETPFRIETAWTRLAASLREKLKEMRSGRGRNR